MDDAWIHRIYSKSFAFGQGFQYNDGSQEAGATSPLWVIVSSPAQWFEAWGNIIVVLGVKLIGIFLGIITIYLIQKIAEVSTNSKMVGIIAASLFALEPRFLFSTLSGMETNLLIALWLGAIYAIIMKKEFLFIILFSLTPITRPEALIILPLCILSLFFSKTLSFQKRLILSIILWVPMLLWSLFCKSTNGHWLPNTFYLKAQSFNLELQDVNMAWQVLSEQGYASLPIFLIGIIVYLICFYKCNHRLKKSLFLFMLLAPIIYMIGVVATRDIILDGYYWTRWLDPVSLLMTIIFCIGYALIMVGAIDFPKFGVSYHNRFMMSIGIVGLFLTIPTFVDSFNNRRERLASDSRAIYLINVQAGQWINKNTAQNATIAVNDAGAIRYFGQRHTIDLIGLNNKEMAFKQKTFAETLDEADWLVIFPDWFAQKLPLIFEKSFQAKVMFRIPLEEYTICFCPGQTTKVIFEKSSPKRCVERINPQNLRR